MKYFITLLVLLIASSSYSQKDYGPLKKFNSLLVQARDLNYDCFLAFANGDTLKGKNIEIKTKGKHKVFLDGKEIIIDVANKNKRLVALQNQDGLFTVGYFYEDEKYYPDLEGLGGRIAKGTICLFVQNDNRNTKLYYSNIYLQKKGGKLERASPAVLYEMIKDNAEAVKRFNVEFPKPTAKETNDYKEIINVLDVYNKN